jgi:DNA repair protein RadC
MYRIRDLAEQEKPRERLNTYGADALDLSELLAVILGTGTRREGVLEISRRILREYGEQAIITYQSVESIKADFAISYVKACQVLAALEIGRRLFSARSHTYPALHSVEDVWQYVKAMGHYRKEYVRGLYLNTRNVLIHDEIISIGSLDTSIAHPREVFLPAITHSAAAVIVVHNHPSGSLTASAADKDLTDRLQQAADILQISLLDHVLVTSEDYKSIC